MKILLVCAVGMSTSILVGKIEKYAIDHQLDIEIKAMGNSNLVEQRGVWDICLMGPQIKYAFKDVQKVLEIPIEVIDVQAYAFSDAEKVIAQAKRLAEQIQK